MNLLHFWIVLYCADIIREKIKKSVTDTIKEINYDPENRPGITFFYYNTGSPKKDETVKTLSRCDEFYWIKLNIVL